MLPLVDSYVRGPAPGRDPGFETGIALSQSGHISGGKISTASCQRATRGTPTSADPALRSTIDPAASTCAPAFWATSTTSRVLPPVVMTSSTTNTFWSGCNMKPRRKVITLSASLSVKRNGTLSARATSWPMMTPPSAGEITRSGRVPEISSSARASALPRRSARAGLCNTRAHWR